MNKYGDNALYRGVVAGMVTFLLAPWVITPLVISLMPQRPYVLPAVIWPLVIGAGLLVARLSRRRDRAAEWTEAGRCGKCGYDLTKNESGRCPECGFVREKVGAEEKSR